MNSYEGGERRAGGARDDADLTYIATLGKRAFMRHDAGREFVGMLADQAKQRLTALNHRRPAGAATCEAVKTQLQMDRVADKRQEHAPAQLQDNLAWTRVRS